jgi:hypothetical protein
MRRPFVYGGAKRPTARMAGIPLVFRLRAERRERDYRGRGLPSLRLVRKQMPLPGEAGAEGDSDYCGLRTKATAPPLMSTRLLIRHRTS